MNYLKNIEEIKKKSNSIYKNLEASLSDESYLRLEKSKNGEYLIPILKNGKPCHSKYSHVNESVRRKRRCCFVLWNRGGLSY